MSVYLGDEFVVIFGDKMMLLKEKYHSQTLWPKLKELDCNVLHYDELAPLSSIETVVLRGL